MENERRQREVSDVGRMPTCAGRYDGPGFGRRENRSLPTVPSGGELNEHTQVLLQVDVLGGAGVLQVLLVILLEGSSARDTHTGGSVSQDPDRVFVRFGPRLIPQTEQSSQTH